jgi:DNA-directed RNA polymerase specialized sigma24 family protein
VRPALWAGAFVVSVSAGRVEADPGWVQRVVAERLRELEGPVVRAVVGRLRRENVSLAVPDIEAAYNRAWHGVYETMLQGRRVENLMGLLVTITYMRSIETYRLRHEAEQSDEPLEKQIIDVDLAEHVDDQEKINGLLARLSERLTEKEQGAVSLCLLRGYPRAETAERLGLSERALKKVMDSANKKLAGIVTMVQPRGCGDDEWARALRAYALAAMDPDSRDRQRIELHIQDCRVCKRYVVGLRGLAVVFPPILPFAHDPVGLLAHLHQLLAPTQPATSATATGVGAGTAGAATAPAAGVPAAAGGAAITGSSAGTASGGGLTSLLGGGGLVKATAIVATVLTASAVGITVHAAGRHHAKAPRSNTAQSGPVGGASVALFSSPVPVGIGPVASATHVETSVKPKRSHRKATGRSSAGRTAATSSRTGGGRQGSDFGFERQSSETQASTVSPASSATSGGSGRTEEFGLEGG